MKQFTFSIGRWLLENAAMLTSLLGAAVVRVIIDRRYKKLSKWQMAAKFFIAFFCGTITGLILVRHNMATTAVWAGPLATLSGESAIVWLTFHLPGIMDDAYTIIKKKNDK